MRSGELTVSPLMVTAAAASTQTVVEMGGVEVIRPSDYAGWNGMVAANEHGSLFHTVEWASVLESAYGYRPQYFLLRRGQETTAFLPLMEVDSWLTGRRGVSLPFTDDCEPFCGDADSFKKLFDAIVAHGRSLKWKYIELRGGRRWLGDAPPSVSFYGHEVDLAGNEEHLLARMDGAVRRAIRKAEKDGVTVEVSDSLEAMRQFFGLLCKTRRKHGMPPQPFQFFERIHEHVITRKLGVVMLAWFDGKPIAGAVYFGFGGRAVYKYGASDEAFQQLRGNNVVMWEAIKWHARRGFKKLHLGRTSLGNDGLRRFKLGWGSVEQKIEYMKFDLQTERFVMDRDGSAGWHNKLFGRMPVFASRLIGAGLYRHWA